MITILMKGLVIIFAIIATSEKLRMITLTGKITKSLIHIFEDVYIGLKDKV